MDRLSELQLREMLEFVEQGGQKGTAALLLASSEFLTRLENPSLQFLKDRLAARLEFPALTEVKPRIQQELQQNKIAEVVKELRNKAKVE